MLPSRPTHSRPFVILAGGIATLLSLGGTVSAVDWLGTVNSDWNNGANWNGGVIPGPGVDANIYTVGPNIPTISADILAIPTDIRVGQRMGQTAPGFGILNHTAGTASTGLGNWMTVGAGTDTVGIYNLGNTNTSGGTLTRFGTGSGSMTVNDSKLWVGGTDNESGGEGFVNMNTTGSLTIGNDLFVGANSGYGVFNLDAGTVNRTGGWTVVGRTNGSGEFNMTGGTYTGTGESLFGIDNGSTGKLNVSGGSFSAGGNFMLGRNQGVGIAVVRGTGSLTAGGETNVGLNANSTGSLAVTGGTVTFNANWHIGRDGGTGALNVTGGAVSGGGEAFVGLGTGGSGTLTQTGGTVTINNWLNVGRDGATGELNMSGGAMTVSEQVRIGWGGLGDGSLTMTGSGSLTGKNVAIGENAGTGVAIVNGHKAFLSSTEQFFVGNDAVTSGTLTVSAGTVQSGSWMAVGRQGATGVMTINGTGLVRQGVADVNSFFELTNANAGGSATVNLDGGTLSINGIRMNGGGTALTTMNLNGGTIRAQRDDGDFMQSSITTANVRNGGAVVDTNGFGITFHKALTHSAIGGDNAIDGGLRKEGLGTLTLTGVNSYTGSTVVNGGILALGGAGSILDHPTGIVVNGDGRQMTYPYASGQTRSGSLALTGLTSEPLGTTPVILNNGQLIHNGSGDGTQTADLHAYTVQNVVAASGMATFSNQPYFGSQALTIGNLSRNIGSTVEFKSNFGVLGTAGDNGQVKLANLNGVAFAGNDATGMVGGWAIAYNGDGAPWDSYWASYDAATGMKAYTGVYAASVAGSTAADNVRLTTAEVVAVDSTIHSLIVQGNTLSIDPGVTLQVETGGVIITYGDTDHISGGKLTTGLVSGELFVHVYDGAYDQGTGRFRLNTNIVDNGATATRLVKSGTGTLRLSSASEYTGGTFVNSGSLQIRNAGALGTGAVNVAPGAQLQFGPTLGADVMNNITLNGVAPGGALVGGMDGGVIVNTYAGTLTLAATSNVTTDWSDKTLTLAGKVTGPGGLIVGLRHNQQGSRIVLANPTNDYAGNTLIESRADGDQPTLIAGAANVIPNGVGKGNLIVNGALDMQTFNQSANGLSGTGTIFSESGASLIAGLTDASSYFDGNITSKNGASFTLTKVGTGTLTLGGTGDNGFLDIAASEGTTVLAKAGGGARTASTVSVASGATVKAGSNPAAAGDSHIFNGLANAGTVDVSGFNLAVGASISGGGVVTNSSAAPGTLTLGVNGTGSSTFAGTIQNGTGTLAVIKTGATIQTLSGANTYTGGTTVQGGTLIVDGSIAGTATVAAGGTLGGSGMIDGVIVSGTLAPGGAGGGAGTLDMLSLDMRDGSTLAIDLNGVGALADQVAATGPSSPIGNVTLTGNITLTLSLGFDPADFTDSFVLIANDGIEPIAGGGLFTYLGTPLAEGDIFFVSSNGFDQSFQIGYAAGDGNDVGLLAVPEPGSATLLGLAAVLLAGRRRRQSRR